MRMVPKDKAERLKFFSDLYTDAKSKTSDQFALLDRHLKQYRGDSAIDGGVDADVVRNITYELIESQVSSHIPRGKVTPRRASDRGFRNARSVETLLAQLRDMLPFEEMNDMDERYTYVFGGSIFLAEWDESITTHSTVGDIRVSHISPENFVPQPGIYNVQDMEYCFVTFTSAKEELMRKYNVKWEVAEAAQNDEDTTADETATEYVCFYKDDEGRLCQFIWSDDVVLLDLPNYYSRKRKYCRKCGKREQICNCEKPEIEVRDEDYEELTRDVVRSDESVIPAMSPAFDDSGNPITEEVEVPILAENGGIALGVTEAGQTLPMSQTVTRQKTAPTRIPFYTPSLIPIVIRKNTSQEKSVLGQSDCEAIRPQQQGINKIETRIMQKLMRAGVTPMIPEDASVTINNSVFGQVIKLRPGESAANYGTIDNTPSIAQDIAASDRLYDQAKRILGISSSFQGQADTTALSGYAKQVQANQSAGRLESKKRMKNAAYANLDQIMFQLYLAYADEPRPATYRDGEGRLQEVSFNRYDFIECDEAGEWYYDDQYLFSADASADISQTRELLWQLNEKNFASGTYGDPSLPETQLNFWLNMAEAHYPYAQANVDRLRLQIRKKAEAEQLAQRLADAESEIESRKGYEEQLRTEGDALVEELEHRKGYEEQLRSDGDRLVKELDHLTSSYEDYAKK